MEPARPRSPRRRPRRGTPARPVNTHLLRNASLLLLGPVLVLMFTAIRPGALPPPALPPAFDAVSALRLTQELARDYPNRVPGTAGADRAARWYRDRLAPYGLPVVEDRWRTGVLGVGEVELANLVTVVPGSSDEVIVIVAHRDNTGGSSRAGENASGTAALVELIRSYAVTGSAGRRLEPHHTLVFLSSDGGAYGSLGAARFARTSPLSERAVAVLSLDGLAGAARPRLELASYTSHASPPALYRTVAARVREQTGGELDRPGWLTQLVDLALPFGYGEQAQFLAAGRPAVRLATVPDTATGESDVAALDPLRLGQLGRGAEASLVSLDAAIQLSGRTAAFLYVGDRALRGWALKLLLASALVPFAVVTLDLLGRAFRRGLRLAPYWRALRRRLGLWLAIAALVFGAALAGALPLGGPLPPPADAPPLDRWPAPAAAAVAVLAAAFWVRSRRRRPSLPTERGGVGGYTVCFTALLLVSLVVAVVNTYALVFVLPSLYAWLWLPQLRARRAWVGDAVYGLGLVGPAVALVVLAEQLDLGLRAPLYAVGLATSGTTPWLLSVCALCWAAVAGELAELLTTGSEAEGAQARRV